MWRLFLLLIVPVAGSQLKARQWKTVADSHSDLSQHVLQNFKDASRRKGRDAHHILQSESLRKAVAEALATRDPPSSVKGNLNQARVDKLIHDKIGGSYQKNARPIPDRSVFDGTHRIKVYMGLSLRKLLELDHIKGVMSMVVWLRLMWPDFRLRYNASDYFKDVPMFGEGESFKWNSSIDFVPIEQESVWIPDVQILNAVADSQLINRNPRVFWYDEKKLETMGYNMVLVSPQIIHVECPMHLRDFPFDSQECQIQFGDWSASDRYFDFDTINRFSTHMDLPETDTEFRFDNISVDREHMMEHQLVVDTHLPVVAYTLKLTRRPHYYLVEVVLPMFLLVLLGQGLYWMDLEKERFSTGITTILAVMTVSFMTAKMMPKVPETMWLEKFNIGCYILTCLPTFWSILLDHVKLMRYVHQSQVNQLDAIARLVHPCLVMIFYLLAFGLPGGTVYWPTDAPEIWIFLATNWAIFFVFAASNVPSLPCFATYTKWHAHLRHDFAQDDISETPA